jgi:hypothetical protein
MLITAALLSVTGVAFGAASTSHPYLSDWIAGGGHKDGDRHTLEYNMVYGTSNVCAGQLDSNGNWSGQYSCSDSASSEIKQYCRCNLIYPRAHNGRGSSQYMIANEWW